MLMDNICSVDPSESTSHKENEETCGMKATQTDNIIENKTHSLELKGFFHHIPNF